jgi:hypothetical protein
MHHAVDDLPVEARTLAHWLPEANGGVSQRAFSKTATRFWTFPVHYDHSGPLSREGTDER